MEVSNQTAEVKVRTVHGTFWHYDLVTATTPRRKLKSSQYLSSLYAWAAQNGWIITPFAPPPIKPDKERGDG